MLTEEVSSSLASSTTVSGAELVRGYANVLGLHGVVELKVNSSSNSDAVSRTESCLGSRLKFSYKDVENKLKPTRDYSKE